MSKRPAKALVLPLRLTDDEREFVFEILTKGVHGARVITRARILFKLDKGCSNADIRDALDTTLGTIVKTRKRYLQGGLEYALGELARPGQKPKFDAAQAATIIATACSKAPRWARSLDAAHAGLPGGGAGLRGFVQPRDDPPAFEKSQLKPWQKQEWCIPEVGEEFVAAMEEVIATYTAPHDPHHPVICFDESPFQLLRHVADPRPASPGVARREDYEYERAGVADVMMICQPALGLRKCMVTQSRKKVDFAGVCAEIDRMFPQAKSITLVSDNLNTHTKGAFYLAFEPAQARHLARKFNFVHTPKHGSWLNIAEIELAVLGKTVFKKRIGDLQTLQTELDALCGSRNLHAAPVRWQFNLGKARKKMSWMYPDLIDANQVD